MQALILAVLLVSVAVIVARAVEEIEGRVWSALARNHATKSAVVQQARGRWEQNTFFQQAIDEIDSELGLGTPSQLKDGAFETAEQLTRRIRVGMVKLQRESRLCCKRHLGTAQLRGVTNMYELDHDARCHVSRSKMVALLGVVREYLGMYPFMSDEIQDQAIVVEEMTRYCSPCTYLAHTVAGAPPYCLTAIVLNPDLNPLRNCSTNGEHEQPHPVH